MPSPLILLVRPELPEASQIAVRHQLAMADAAMYSMAQEFGATFWTQDADYQGLVGVHYFPKT